MDDKQKETEIEEPFDYTWFNTELTDAKVLLFARWMATCYEGEMNTQPGSWWKEQLKHFNDVVFPNYKKNGSYNNMIEYLKD